VANVTEVAVAVTEEAAHHSEVVVAKAVRSAAEAAENVRFLARCPVDRRGH
jgi:hypothetical protein